MQEAGRILLMPKGDYLASTTYEMLDLVNHSGASWVCKKECTGQEPSDSNTEFWQRFGTAVDLSNYVAAERMGSGDRLSTSILEKALTLGVGVYNFSLDRGNYTGNDLPDKYYAYGMASVYRSTTAKGTTVILWGGQYDLPISVNMHDGANWFGWDALFTTAGGTVSKAGRSPIEFKSTNSNNVTSLYSGQDGTLGELGFFGANNPTFRNTSGANNTLLHTGNKPTGTYTGNGDATERWVNTDSIGKGAIIYSSQGIAIVTTSGAVLISASGEVSFTTNVYFSSSGAIAIKTTSSVVNLLSKMYYYISL